MQLFARNRLIEVLVRALGPVDFARASALGHYEAVRIASVSLSVVHYAQTMAELVRNHKGRLEVGRLIDCARIVTLAHSADPSES